MKLLFNIMSVVGFVGTIFLVSASLYAWNTYESRVQENRKFILETIEKQVYEQIKNGLPESTGKVIK
tara:strand:- start:510 stop:710 length:201 start_codon:yes stop_codon:yes gene_type:complete